MNRWDKHDPTDLEELIIWTPTVVVAAMLAAAAVVIGLLGLAV